MSDQYSQQALAATLKHAQKKLSKSAGKIGQNLMDVLGANLDPSDLEYFDADLFAETVEHHTTLMEGRKYGQSRIQIYCPVDKKGGFRKTYINVVGDDFAFLIDSVVAEINRQNLLIDLLFHPVVFVERDAKGAIKKLSNDRDPKAERHSHVHVQIKETLSDDALQKLQAGLEVALTDVYYANRDWKKMLERMRDTREELANAPISRPLREIEKYCAFLDYLYDNNFTLLGYREYKFIEKDGAVSSTIVKGSSLGLLGDEIKPAYINENDEGLPRNLQKLRYDLDPVSISKTNRLSTVHRRVPMDAVAVKIYDKNGKICGERLFLGLFTSVTYSRSVSSVPYLREKVDSVIERSGFIQGSHDRKALRHILEKYPRDELFQISEDQLYDISLNILKLQERQRTSLFMRRDPFGRYISCLIYVPRDRFATDLRKQMVAVLERELNGECSNLFTSMDDSVFARIMVVIKVSQKNPPEFDPDKIENKLLEIGQSWPEKISDALVRQYGDDESKYDQVKNWMLRYGNAFPVGYTVRYRPIQAVFDMTELEQVRETGKMQLDLHRPRNMDECQFRLKVYHPGEPITLSSVLPILDDMGLKAIAELPFEIAPEGDDQSIWIHDFQLEPVGLSDSVNIDEIKENFERAFSKVWHKEIESDRLNRLIVSANFNWHETTILRAYVRYLKQIRFGFSRQYIEKAITSHPKISRHLVDLFKAYHNPANGDESAKMVAGIKDSLDQLMRNVDVLDEDRILRMIAKLIDATMRTNYYQRENDGHGKDYLALKISSRMVKEIPDPKPFMEIFVYSTRVEAVHLRGDKIARGGLRWSDRHEDFRTEILGLMKSQMVKNSVIVPMGSKGGFVVKSDIRDRDEFRKEGVECYKIFIRGLLDVTDNRKGQKIIPPKDVVRRDGDDPYLVVAADKGTATFSDIANGLSGEYGFWLGDAFASGGSAGYDHKKMGITARGAWESVKLHFRQMGHNTQTEDFDVIGVGDMGGDVFGNGMLLSEHIRLVAAFNHLHIFCDPDPDPAASFKERKRLFECVGGWDQYNEKLLSKGGRIYSRADKSLELTPEIQARFGISKKEISPPELMKAILQAQTDLIWFGGIGTYIKSKHENDADVGDKSNDAIRVTAGEVKAKVIGEGANLGVTQAGRIEYAKAGGRINADFIDNSGGVDSSDHEVNIKILLSEVMREKSSKMDMAARNKLLEEMTKEVEDLVLRNNYQQAQAVSLVEQQAAESVQIHQALIQELERDGKLDRKIEGLPDDETFEQMLRTGKGLTRPELAVLIAYSKIEFTKDLLASDIPDDSDMDEWIVGYFPKVLQKKYNDEIFAHRLKREIVATTMANSLVNRMGPTFTKSVADNTTASCAEVAKAYIITRDAFTLRKLWDDIEALDHKVPADVQMRAMHEISGLAERAVRWFVTRKGADINIGRDTKLFRQGVQELRDNMDDLLNKELSKLVAKRTKKYISDGLPKELARQIAYLPALASACDIINIAADEKISLMDAARTYFALGERFHMGWLREKLTELHSHDYWENQANSGLIDQLYDCQAGMTVCILKNGVPKGKAKTAKAGKTTSKMELWIEEHKEKIEHLDPLFTHMRRAGKVGLPMLVIAEQRLRNLYHSA